MDAHSRIREFAVGINQSASKNYFRKKEAIL